MSIEMEYGSFCIPNFDLENLRKHFYSSDKTTNFLIDCINAKVLPITPKGTNPIQWARSIDITFSYFMTAYTRKQIADIYPQQGEPVSQQAISNTISRTLINLWKTSSIEIKSKYDIGDLSTKRNLSEARGTIRPKTLFEKGKYQQLEEKPKGSKYKTKYILSKLQESTSSEEKQKLLNKLGPSILFRNSREKHMPFITLRQLLMGRSPGKEGYEKYVQVLRDNEIPFRTFERELTKGLRKGKIQKYYFVLRKDYNKVLDIFRNEGLLQDKPL